MDKLAKYVVRRVSGKPESSILKVRHHFDDRQTAASMEMFLQKRA